MVKLHQKHDAKLKVKRTLLTFIRKHNFTLLNVYKFTNIAQQQIKIALEDEITIVVREMMLKQPLY